MGSRAAAGDGTGTAGADEVVRDKGRYRKVEVRTWGDEKFCALTRIPPCGQGLWLYLITGPQTGPIPGLFKAGRAGMAEELGWELEDFDKAFQEVCQQGMAQADFKARVMWIPNAILHNKPASPNVVRGWANHFDLIPECDLKRKALKSLQASVHAVGEPFGKAFDEAFAKALAKPSAKTLPNQEQEQEQEQSISESKDSADSSDSSIVVAAKPVVNREAVLFDTGKALLGKSAGGLIAAKLKEFGLDVVERALKSTAAKDPSEAKSWFVKSCEQEAKKQKRADELGGFAELLEDPHPRWALDAGFANRWEANNDGCYEHNAKQFREGRKVAA